MMYRVLLVGTVKCTFPMRCAVSGFDYLTLNYIVVLFFLPRCIFLTAAVVNFILNIVFIFITIISPDLINWWLRF